jgi:RNA polymerase sigma factor (sigma-70 family)
MLDEVPQKVIVHLWEDGFRRLRQWRGEGDFVSYLAPIVRHIAADHLRAQPGRREVSLDGDGDGRAGGPVSQSGDEGGETALLEEERRKAARTALASLRERDREILERYCIRGDTAETIARDLGLTAGAFYVALHRAKRRLYEKLLATYPGLFRDLSGWEVRKVATEPSGETNP